MTYQQGILALKKTQELVARKYYWEILCHNVEIYVKGCDVCLVSKAVKDKLYKNLQQLPVPTYCWKNLSMDFVTGLPQSTDWRGDGDDSIMVIINQLAKMVHQKPVQRTITVPALAEVIFNIVIWHYVLTNSIVSNRGLIFTSKF